MPFNIPFAAAGGSAAFTEMPIVTVSPPNLVLKDGPSSVRVSNAANFYTSISTGAADRPWSFAFLQAVANTLEQEVVDVAGKGVLTSILTPFSASAATHTIRVERDGKPPIVFTVDTAANDVALAGKAMHFEAVSTTAPSGFGTANDEAFGTDPRMMMITPLQAVNENDFGIRFDISLRVTIQCSVAYSAPSTSHQAVVLYTTDNLQGV